MLRTTSPVPDIVYAVVTIEQLATDTGWTDPETIADDLSGVLMNAERFVHGEDVPRLAARIWADLAPAPMALRRIMDLTRVSLRQGVGEVGSTLACARLIPGLTADAVLDQLPTLQMWARSRDDRGAHRNAATGVLAHISGAEELVAELLRTPGNGTHERELRQTAMHAIDREARQHPARWLSVAESLKNFVRRLDVGAKDLEDASNLIDRIEQQRSVSALLSKLGSDNALGVLAQLPPAPHPDLPEPLGRIVDRLLKPGADLYGNAEALDRAVELLYYNPSSPLTTSALSNVLTSAEDFIADKTRARAILALRQSAATYEGNAVLNSPATLAMTRRLHEMISGFYGDGIQGGYSSPEELAAEVSYVHSSLSPYELMDVATANDGTEIDHRLTVNSTSSAARSAALAEIGGWSQHLSSIEVDRLAGIIRDFATPRSGRLNIHNGRSLSSAVAEVLLAATRGGGVSALRGLVSDPDTYPDSRIAIMRLAGFTLRPEIVEIARSDSNVLVRAAALEELDQLAHDPSVVRQRDGIEFAPRLA